MTPRSHTPPPVAPERLAQLLDKLPATRVVVVGDVMLDRYLIGDTERLSPEAPVPVVHIRDRQARLGGAANVAANVAAVGATSLLVGAIGDDMEGEQLRRELALARIPDSTLHPVAGRPTTSKTRVVARGQQVCRIDDEVDTVLEPPALAAVERLALQALSDADALLLEDYNKGCLAPALITTLIAAAGKRGIPVVVDPKYRNFFAYGGATVFKPNRRELEAALGAAVDLAHPDTLPAVVERLNVQNLLLTLGADGMVLIPRTGDASRVPSIAREVFDVSGAGDTVTAWLGMALAAGASMLEAAMLANYAAGVEVSKAGVATVSPSEVLAAYEEQYDPARRMRRGGLI